MVLFIVFLSCTLSSGSYLSQHFSSSIFFCVPSGQNNKKKKVLWRRRTSHASPKGQFLRLSYCAVDTRGFPDSTHRSHILLEAYPFTLRGILSDSGVPSHIPAFPLTLRRTPSHLNYCLSLSLATCFTLRNIVKPLRRMTIFSVAKTTFILLGGGPKLSRKWL